MQNGMQEHMGETQEDGMELLARTTGLLGLNEDDLADATGFEGMEVLTELMIP